MGRGGKAGPAKGTQKRKASRDESPPGFVDPDSDSPTSSAPTYKKSRQRISDLLNVSYEDHATSFKTQTEPTTRNWIVEGESEDGDPDTWFTTRSLFEPESVETPSQLPTLRFYSDRALVLARLVKQPGEKLFLKCPADVNVDGKIRKLRRHRGDPVITKLGAVVTINGEPMTGDWVL
jgi:hypothetical protein